MPLFQLLYNPSQYSKFRKKVQKYSEAIGIPRSRLSPSPKVVWYQCLSGLWRFPLNPFLDVSIGPIGICLEKRCFRLSSSTLPSPPSPSRALRKHSVTQVIDSLFAYSGVSFISYLHLRPKAVFRLTSMHAAANYVPVVHV